MHTVVATPEFLSGARRLLSEEERAELVAHLAGRPDAGALIPGTGGARKLRWAVGGRGKRGGARVITYYGGPGIPVFLLAIFGKGAKTDMTQAERNELRGVLGKLAGAYRGSAEQ